MFIRASISIDGESKDIANILEELGKDMSNLYPKHVLAKNATASSYTVAFQTARGCIQLEPLEDI